MRSNILTFQINHQQSKIYECIEHTYRQLQKSDHICSEHIEHNEHRSEHRSEVETTRCDRP